MVVTIIIAIAIMDYLLSIIKLTTIIIAENSRARVEFN